MIQILKSTAALVFKSTMEQYSDTIVLGTAQLCQYYILSKTATFQYRVLEQLVENTHNRENEPIGKNLLPDRGHLPYLGQLKLENSNQTLAG